MARKLLGVAATTPTEAMDKADVDALFTTRMDSASIKIITQAAYTALGAGRPAGTIYFIVG